MIDMDAKRFLEDPDVQGESGLNTYYSRDLVLEMLDAAIDAALAAAPAQERIDALELEVRQLTERTAALQKPYEKGKHMTPEQHAAAIEDAVEFYLNASIGMLHFVERVDLREFAKTARQELQAAIIAGVGAAPEGWQLVPVEPTNAMLDALEDAARYRWLASHCRSTSEHWGGRWSIVVDGPTPKSHDSEDDFDAAIDAAMDKERRAFVTGVKAATEPPAKPKPCGACSGSGRYDSTGSPKCASCNGSGIEPPKGAAAAMTPTRTR